jgi:hypothetical protein
METAQNQEKTSFVAKKWCRIEEKEVRFDVCAENRRKKYVTRSVKFGSGVIAARRLELGVDVVKDICDGFRLSSWACLTLAWLTSLAAGWPWHGDGFSDGLSTTGEKGARLTSSSTSRLRFSVTLAWLSSLAARGPWEGLTFVDGSCFAFDDGFLCYTC